MLAVVQDGLRGGKHFDIGAEWLSTVRIAVEAREVAAGHFEPDAVAALKEIARHP